MDNKRKIIGICGASDCFLDPDWPGISWMEKLESLLPTGYEVKNFSLEGASNFLISLQVEKAIESCDVVLVNFTSSVRFEYCVKQPSEDQDLFDRFFRYHQSQGSWSLISTSPLSVYKNPVLNTQQQNIIKDFFANFHDIEVDIKKNFIFIKHSIESLIKSQKKFMFSTGGFEHRSYMDRDSPYLSAFDEYKQYQSKYNLWDHIRDYKAPRPYFHITDTDTTDKIARYYLEFILNKC